MDLRQHGQHGEPEGKKEAHGELPRNDDDVEQSWGL
jgi:hypothetical protein